MSNVPTEADLDASVEMLAFMWLAAGNDPASLTPEALGVIRFLLPQRLAQLSPELQSIFANARANNVAVQESWMSAAPEVKILMALQYQQVLAAIGIGYIGGAAPSSDAGSDSGYSLGEIASNTAWNTSTAGDWSAR